MKIQYYTKDHVALALCNLNPHLPSGADVEKLYDLGEDYNGKPRALCARLAELLPHLAVVLDRIYDGPDSKYYRYKLVDRLGNRDYLKFIYM